MKTIVIGGGPSGIMAAYSASKHSDVTLIERNSKIGKKLSITGNGRCNFWNEIIDASKYNSEAEEFLNCILNKKDEVYLELTQNIGITPITKNGYIYPYSKAASSVVTTFERLLSKNNIDILYDLKVTDINVDSKIVTLSLSDNTEIKCDHLIIATGSKATSKTGSDGNGYILLNKLGITINEVIPALTPLITDDSIKKIWTGVRSDAKITVMKNKKIIKEETGEIQLTEQGISGIVTFNVSSLVSSLLKSHTDFDLLIDFLPEIKDIYTFLDNKNKKSNATSIEELLETIFNYKLLYALLKCSDIERNSTWDNLDEEKKLKLVNNIKEYKLNIIDTEDFNRSQVCHGGVSLDEITPSFSLKKYPNIKVVGEVLNVDGICGGYNLAFAFISGYIAGSSIND